MLRSLKSIRGFELLAFDGEIGKLREFYFDEHSWIIRYFVADTGGWLIGRNLLIPPHSIKPIDEENETAAVHLSRDQIRNSPPLLSDPPSREYEETYHRYFGWEPYWASAAGTPAFSIPARPEEDQPGTVKTTEPATPIPRDDMPEGTPEAMAKSYLRSSEEARGFAIHAKDGHIGHLEDFVIDDEDWRIRYLVVDTLNWFPGKFVLAPVEWISRFSFPEREVFVDVTKDRIRGAPEYDPDLPVDRAVERRLYELSGYHAYWEPIHAARLGR